MARMMVAALIGGVVLGVGSPVRAFTLGETGAAMGINQTLSGTSAMNGADIRNRVLQNLKSATDAKPGLDKALGPKAVRVGFGSKGTSGQFGGRSGGGAGRGSWASGGRAGQQGWSAGKGSWVTASASGGWAHGGSSSATPRRRY